jgi:hypothetical protein
MPEKGNGKTAMTRTLAAIVAIAAIEAAGTLSLGIRLPWMLPFWGAGILSLILWGLALRIENREEERNEGIATDSDAAAKRLDDVRSVLDEHAAKADPELAGALLATSASCADIGKLLERSPEAFARGGGLFDYAIPKILSVLPAYFALDGKSALSASQKTRLEASRTTLLRLPALFDAHLQTMQENDVQLVVERIRALEHISLGIENPSV